MNRDWLDKKSDQFDDQRLNIAYLFKKYMEEQHRDVEKAMESLTEFLEAREKVISQFIADTQKKLDDKDTNLEDKLNASYDIYAAKLLLGEIRTIYSELAESVSEDKKLLIDIKAVSDKIYHQTSLDLSAFEARLESIGKTITEMNQLAANIQLSSQPNDSLKHANDHLEHVLKKKLLLDKFTTPEIETMTNIMEKLSQKDYKQYRELDEFCRAAINVADKNKSMPTEQGAKKVKVALNSIESHKIKLLDKQASLNDKQDEASKDDKQKINSEQRVIMAALKRLETAKKIITDSRLSKDYSLTVSDLAVSDDAKLSK